MFEWGWYAYYLSMHIPLTEALRRRAVGPHLFAARVARGADIECHARAGAGGNVTSMSGMQK